MRRVVAPTRSHNGIEDECSPGTGNSSARGHARVAGPDAQYRGNPVSGRRGAPLVGWSDQYLEPFHAERVYPELAR